MNKFLTLCCVAALSLASACGGSAISPEVAAKANQGVLGAGGNGPGTVTGPGVETGTDPGTGTAVAPGSTGRGTSSGGQATSGSGTGTSSGGGKAGAAGANIKAGSCAGFKNGTGITSSTITIGNASDVSGPVPGLFAASQQATKAYVTYFNATNPQGICGRKLVVKNYDTKTDAGANQVAYTQMCGEVFASVGSMSAFDAGAGPTAAKCGLPSLNAAAVQSAFNACGSCFGVDASGQHEFTNEAYDFWTRNNKAATKKAAFLYLNAGAAQENAQTQINVGKKRGINWVYTQGVDVAEFNYSPYVQKLKSEGVTMVQFLGAWQQEVRWLQAMQSNNYRPQIMMFDPSAYEPGFLANGGSAAEGSFMYMVSTPITENQAEMNLYRKWLGQAAPGATPTFFGTFSWSATKLFVEKAIALGGRLNRPNLVSAFKATNGWTGGGIHAPMSVGNKHPPSCMRYLTVKGNKWIPYKGTKYVCNGYSKG